MRELGREKHCSTHLRNWNVSLPSQQSHDLALALVHLDAIFDDDLLSASELDELDDATAPLVQDLTDSRPNDVLWLWQRGEGRRGAAMTDGRIRRRIDARRDVTAAIGARTRSISRPDVLTS